jgi:2-amino-4-hydroxy-6-hydroxymethyldihydropteridine diphosphokinase
MPEKIRNSSIDVVLSLGSNLGDRAFFLRRMGEEIGRLLLPPVRFSRLMETEPLGVSTNQEWFYNRLVRGGYRGTSRSLLSACQAIENALGRTRPEKYAARTADIDILLFGDSLINEPDLIVPHPAIQKRRFCIMGLCEVAPELVFPGIGRRVDEAAKEWMMAAGEQEMKIIEE